MKTSIMAAALILSQVALYGQNPTSLKNQVPAPPDLGKKYQQINKIPPRYQWEHNGGYCGETSMISAGLYYGQYLSQYDVRTIASPGMAPPLPSDSQNNAAHDDAADRDGSGRRAHWLIRVCAVVQHPRGRRPSPCGWMPRRIPGRADGPADRLRCRLPRRHCVCCR